jgi:8-oxo-dGTP diphosphatase
MRIICAALIEKEGKYLLVNAKMGVPKGLWNNSGGHKEEGESVEEAVIREVKEETGYDIELGKLIGTYTYKSGEGKKYVYEARIIGGKLELPEDEIEEVRWFSVDEVRKLRNVTFGAFRSVIDYSEGKFDQEYDTDRVF